jgi:hypothetical protein
MTVADTRSLGVVLTLVAQTNQRQTGVLLHVLPSGFRRIRHYGLLANANRKTQTDVARPSSDGELPEVFET